MRVPEIRFRNVEYRVPGCEKKPKLFFEPFRTMRQRKFRFKSGQLFRGTLKTPVERQARHALRGRNGVKQNIAPAVFRNPLDPDSAPESAENNARRDVPPERVSRLAQIQSFKVVQLGKRPGRAPIFTCGIHGTADHDGKLVRSIAMELSGHIKAVFDEHILHSAQRSTVQKCFRRSIDPLKHQRKPLPGRNFGHPERHRESEVNKLPLPQQIRIAAEIRIRDHPGPMQIRRNISRHPRRNRHLLTTPRMPERETPSPLRYVLHRNLHFLRKISLSRLV